MKQITDTAGRVWQIEATYASLKRIKSLTGHDPLALQEFLGTITQIELLVNVLWAFVQPQAEKLGITDEQFGQGLGEAAWDGFEAIVAELPNFFLRQERPKISKVLTMVLEATRKATDRRVNEWDAEKLAVEIEKQLESRPPPKNSGNTASTPPVSPELTPTP